MRKKLNTVFLLSLFILLTFTSQGLAQSEDFDNARCTNGFSKPDARIARNLAKTPWKITWTHQGTTYHAYLKISQLKNGQQKGVSITKFYRADQRRNAYVRQSILVCNRDGVRNAVVLVGYNPRDVDRDNRDYAADNFLLVFNRGKMTARIVDQLGNFAEIKSEQLKVLQELLGPNWPSVRDLSGNQVRGNGFV